MEEALQSRSEEAQREKGSEFNKLIMRRGEEATAEVRNTMCQMVPPRGKEMIFSRIRKACEREYRKETYVMVQSNEGPAKKKGRPWSWELRRQSEKLEERISAQMNWIKRREHKKMMRCWYPPPVLEAKRKRRNQQMMKLWEYPPSIPPCKGWLLVE